ncbi:MAG: spore germination protein GerW family protein [Polyangiales bacterium]
MDTPKLKETLQNELERLARVRDELRVQASVAKADTRTELNRLDSVWQRVQDELRRLGEQAKAPATELGAAARSLVDELAQGYGRIKRDLEESGLNSVAQRTLSALSDAAAGHDPANLQGPRVEAQRAATDEPLMRLLNRIGGQVGAAADASAVFASPVTKDGVTVIPVARVFGGFGAGAIPPGVSAGQGVGPGLGGGGFGAQPVGFIEIDRDGARFRRIDTPVESWFSAAMVALDVARRAGTWAYATYKRRRR